MTIHIPTLLVSLLLGFLLLSLQLAVAQRGLPGSVPMRLWTHGSWLLLAGFAALAARLVVPDWLSILLGNGAIVAGLVFYCRASFVFLLGRDVPPLYWALFVTCLVSLPFMLSWPLNERTAVLSAQYALLMVPAVVLIFWRGWGAERSLRMVGLTLGLAALAQVIRAVHAWTNPLEYQNLFQASLGQGLTFLGAFLCMLGAGFGFVLAGFERVARRLEELATHDGLTGCTNRITADSLLEHAMLRGQREGAPVSLILLDVDHFKLVNDQHGHRAGDTVLRRFADTVRTRLRASDVFSRVGGEEFSVLLPGTDEPGARRVAEDIRRAVAEMLVVQPDGRSMQISVSAGVATAGSDSGWPPDRLYARADQALYRAKALGRNRVEVASTLE